MTRDLLNGIEKKFGTKHPYKSDEELFESLKKGGLPSLVKLLKLTEPK